MLLRPGWPPTSNSDRSSAGSPSANTVISLPREARSTFDLAKSPSMRTWPWASELALASTLPAPSSTSTSAPGMATPSFSDTV
ncbi:Uncharacterised protein [Bordetella pertussis]|nr:Uncharacterised protein [Bordetella pertussis]CFW05166.1 Uncharacterised protein [Bordetella pertussis]CFW37575.1 Uncharacterised protein [Bordetella pertussis]